MAMDPVVLIDERQEWKPTPAEKYLEPWKLRFMPDEVGTWTYNWAFDDKTFQAKEVSAVLLKALNLVCAAN